VPLTSRPGAGPDSGDPPVIRIGGYDQRCDDCHKLFASVPERTRGRPRTQHTEIDLRHGLNDGCLNCHDIAERERLRLHSGETVPFSEVAQLCAQCHGPVYRDWELGVHGKTVGAWNPELDQPVRYTCTNCHDPHAPAYPGIEPLPAPNTLRLEHDHDDAHLEIGLERNVLLRWSRMQAGANQGCAGGADDRIETHEPGAQSPEEPSP